MTVQQFAKEKGISISKVKKMALYIKGATKCPCCKAWNIPENAMPIYIPDKRNYSLFAKQYCYVMDAISLGMELHPQLSSVDKKSYKTILKELYKHNLIVEKEGTIVENWNYLDFTTTLNAVDWQNKIAKDKSEMICKTIIACANAVTEVSKTVRLIAG